MKKLLFGILSLLLFVLPSAAQSVTVSGNLKDIVGTAVSSAYVQFDLTGCNLKKFTPRVSGAVLGKYVKQFAVDSTGAFTGSIYGNDEITCNGANTTLYRTQIFVGGKNIGWTKYYTIKTTDSPWSLNTATDVTGSVSLASNSPTACVGAACWLTGIGAPVGGCTNGAIYTRTDNSSTLYICDNSAWVAVSGGSGAFSTLSGGTNSSAAMVVGTGSTLGYSGSGSINANEYKGGAASGTGSCLTHQYVITTNDAAAPTCQQPSIADLSDGSTIVTLSGTQSLTNKNFTGVGNTFPTFNQSTTGNAATATALAATPSQCGANNFSTGITTAGNANCTTISTSTLSDGSHVVKDNAAATFGAFLYDFSSAKLKPPHTTVASLPTASASQYFIYIVTDGVSSTDCTAGAGTNYVWCTSNGSAWVALAGSGAGGSGTVNSGTAGQLAWYATTGSAVSGNTGATVDSGGNITAPTIKTTNSNGGFDGTEGTGAGLTAGLNHDLMWPDSTAHRWKFNNNNGGSDNVLGAASIDTVTNKTFDTSGTGNVFKIAGIQITAVAGNTGTVATTTGAFTNGNCLETDANHNIKDSGNPCGTGSGGSGGGANYGTSFTGQTSVTILGTTHNLNTKNLLVSCYDNASPANRIEPANISIDGGTFDVAVTFAQAQTGYCVVNGSGPPKYSTTFTSQTSVTVPGATHGLNTADLHVMVYDAASGTRTEIIPASVTINSSTFDVTVTFAQAQSGRLVIQ